MLQKKKTHPLIKTQLHPRNKHRERYDFNLLISTCPDLKQFVNLNLYDDLSVDFFDPNAVKMLNKALLKHYYDIQNWDIPANYLCPPIPSRADYIHYTADLLVEKKSESRVNGSIKRCLDIGVGANCVYPIIGIKEYDWSFVGSDIDPISIESASKIRDSNPILTNRLELRLQKDPTHIFEGIINENEQFDLCICNPPFHASAEEAQAGSNRKINNLTGNKSQKVKLNFGGQNKELWCKGGEEWFVGQMVRESKQFEKSCLWFSSLVSKEASLKSIYNELKNVKAKDVKTINMEQGNKISRIVAWRF